MNYELVVAQSAIFVSVVSLATSIYFSLGARRHDRKTVLPYPYLERADYENEVRVRLHNKGTGPMLAQRVVTTHPVGSGHLIDLVPDEVSGDLTFAAFTRVNDERSILPGEFVDLLCLAIDGGTDQISAANDLRRFLTDCPVEVKYTDVYRSTFDSYTAECSWFGRRFRP